MSTRIGNTRARMRKEPRQAPSRATVETIIEAGARVLAEEGWAGFTTNRVADVVGVSIGSLYQYFPDKLSLTEAIRRRHFDAELLVIRRSGDERKPFLELVEDLVGGMIEAHSVHPALHRVLLDEAPGTEGSRSAPDAFMSEYLDHYEAIVVRFQSNSEDVGSDIVAKVLSSAVEGVIHNAARRGTLQSPELKQELVTLVSSYLHGTNRQ